MYNQPRYEDGCAQAGLSPKMNYMPNYFPVMSDEIKQVSNAKENNSVEQDMIEFNSRIFDSIGTLDHLKEAERVMKFKELCASLQNVACQSPLHFKHAAAALIATTNQLSSMQKGNTGAIRMSAIEKQRGRRSRNVFDNKSSLCPTKKMKSTTTEPINDENNGSSKFPGVVLPSFSCNGVTRSNCVTCRDKFGERYEVYAGHRSGSSKCPHRYDNPNVLKEIKEMSV